MNESIESFMVELESSNPEQLARQRAQFARQFEAGLL
jgi:hypothetical protein